MKNILFTVAFINMILIMPLVDVNPLYAIIDIAIMVWCLLKFGYLVEKENKKGLDK